MLHESLCAACHIKMIFEKFRVVLLARKYRLVQILIIRGDISLVEVCSFSNFVIIHMTLARRGRKYPQNWFKTAKKKNLTGIQRIAVLIAV